MRMDGLREENRPRLFRKTSPNPLIPQNSGPRILVQGEVNAMRGLAQIGR